MHLEGPESVTGSVAEVERLSTCVGRWEALGDLPSFYCLAERIGSMETDRPGLDPSPAAVWPCADLSESGFPY